MNALTQQSQTDYTAFKSALDAVSQNAQGFYDTNFVAPLETLVASANTFYNTTFIPNLQYTTGLATAAFSDFTAWIEQKKIDSTQQIQDLIDQLNQIISEGDVGELLVRMDALEATALVKSDVVDVLDSSDSEKVLSANQGRVLDETKANKSKPSAAGNLAALDENGNLFDTGSPFAIPKGNAGGDLTGTFPNPSLVVLNPQVETSQVESDTITADEVVFDVKGRILGVFRRTHTLPKGSGKKRFEVYWSQSDDEIDNDGAVKGWTGEYFADGATRFPDFYARLKQISQLLTTYTDYQARITANGSCSLYTVDVDMVGAPLPGAIRFPMLTNYIRGARSGENVGTELGDAIRNIVGWINSYAPSEQNVPKSGAMSNSTQGTSSTAGMNTGSANRQMARFDFNASLVVPVAEENLPKTQVLYPWIVV